MFRFDKLTVKAQEGVQEAQEIAARHDQQHIEPLHLLAALLTQSDGISHRCSIDSAFRPRLSPPRLRMRWRGCQKSPALRNSI